MRLMPYVFAAAAVAVAVAWVALSYQLPLGPDGRTAAPPPDAAWAVRERGLASLVAGLGVLIVGSVVVIAVNSERRDGPPGAD